MVICCQTQVFCWSSKISFHKTPSNVTKDNTEDNNGARTSRKDHESLRWFPIVHDVTIRWLHLARACIVYQALFSSPPPPTQPRAWVTTKVLSTIPISIWHNVACCSYQKLFKVCQLPSQHECTLVAWDALLDEVRATIVLCTIFLGYARHKFKHKIKKVQKLQNLMCKCVIWKIY